MTEPYYFTPPGLEDWERTAITALATVIEAGEWDGPETTIAQAMPDSVGWKRDHIRDITAHVLYEPGPSGEAMARELRAMTEETRR